jgi:hypothetical protein
MVWFYIADNWKTRYALVASVTSALQRLLPKAMEATGQNV